MGNFKSEEIGPLPLTIVTLKRTGGDGTGKTTFTTGYMWHSICELQPSRSGSGEYLFILNRFFGTGQMETKGRIAFTEFMYGNQGFI